ncbi:NADH-quinone oxidoreductase subunit J [[Mycobacterium] wendilense]|uniref:NADH-quinone oxidoreductase subunit J n=1 Tax=[Mycobacterium] wendilense TaxID=3064284 RepID=A0ABM9MFY7_9MYCO|nr:NADH-quinone oxidoreductase subunit J [Mycolicibacterium sp. MU0050]CAJ1584269.1 NADH-quinone oxidoreductase subunit J [Mycolicibacterium sp. MU0050]
MSTESIVFWAIAPLIVVFALGVVAAPKAVYSALCLAGTMVGLAIVYASQDALFLSVVQVVVYTGAVMMLFLFVLMLVGVDSSQSLTETIRGQRVAAIVAGVGFGLLLIAAIGSASISGFTIGGVDAVSGGRSASLAPEGNVQGLAALIFTKYLWVFELTSALLITAALGAMVLAYRERFEHRKSQRELAQERFANIGAASSYPSTLPCSGVYARQNSVDTPALLPDGSICELSVSRTLERRGLVLTLLVAGDGDASPFKRAGGAR